MQKAHLPDLLLGTEIRAFVSELLDPTVREKQVLECTFAFNVAAGILIVDLLITLGEIVKLVVPQNKLLLRDSLPVLESPSA
jgi:hypothetical protein